MHTTTFIQEQLTIAHEMFHEFADDLTEAEWTAIAFPGTNPIGFTLWHMPRTQDWTVHTAIRGVSEVIADERWANWSSISMAGIGVGITSEQASAVSRSIVQAEVLAYADTVHTTIQNWLSTLSDEDLDIVPDMETHGLSCGLPASILPRGDRILPVWRFLVSPCCGHLRDHLGELGVLKQILRDSLRQS